MQGTIFRHQERDIFISAHIDDLLLIGNRADSEEIYEKLSKKLTLKKDGPFGTEDPGRLFYLKRQVDIGEDGIYISPNAKYIPKLAELLGITERRGKSVPHHNALTVYDAEAIPMEEYLDERDAKMFRSALGICLYLAQERLDTQQNSASFIQLHGTPDANSPMCPTQIGKLSHLHPRHEDALPKGRNLCIHFDKVEWFGRAQGWKSLRDRALQRQRLGKLQNHKEIYVFRFDLCEFLLCAQSQSCTSFDRIIFNGGRDFGGDKFAGGRNSTEAATSIPTWRCWWFEQQLQSSNAAET